MGKEVDWADGVLEVFHDIEIRQVAHVPDAGHARLIALCQEDAGINTVSLSTEEEGIAVLAGAWLGGVRGAQLMQSSGVGNCINMFAMIQECRIPHLSLVTMRGEWGEFNPWQVPMGQATARLLTDIGVIVERVDARGRLVEAVRASARMAFDANRAVAVLVSQQILGFKEWNQ